MLNREFKVWGIRNRIFESEMCEIDLLSLLPHSFCSVHSHQFKINKFIVLEGELIIRTDFGDAILKKGQQITVEPPNVHQFKTGLRTKIIEIAYVKEAKIDPNDIIRQKQGGRIIDGKEYSLDKMKEKNLIKILDTFNYYL